MATATRALVDAVKGTSARIVCTRKTTPGLRVLEKYAVRCGGGFNHRFGLDDAVLIKDNHLVAAGGIRPAIERIRAGLGHMAKIEIEVDTLAQLEEALSLKIDTILLDNMPPETLRQAVALAKGRATLEASGNITVGHRPRRRRNRRGLHLVGRHHAQRAEPRPRSGFLSSANASFSNSRPSLPGLSGQPIFSGHLQRWVARMKRAMTNLGLNNPRTCLD